MLEIGSFIDGKYKILNEIGHGGMSNVYLAMNEKANKTWAVKEVRKQGIRDFEVIRQSLMIETDLLKKISHPNLPSIVDVIEENDNFLIVMDYVDGKTLEKLLKERGTIRQEEVVDWAMQLCNVLDYLHHRTPPIIYRDMKPSNIMLKSDGTVILIDFGTAREYKTEKQEDTTCLGTKGYAAPEQFGGMGQTDARTDIYSLGATMYHLLTGHNPAKPPYEMYPVRYWNAKLSSGLEYIIEKCVKKNPEERYQSAAELLYALQRYRTLDESAVCTYRKNRKIFRVLLGASMLCMAGAIGFFAAAKTKQSHSYQSVLSQAQKMTNETDALETYMQAIAIDAVKADAYEGMYEVIVSDGCFTREEETKLLELNISTENYLQKFKEKNRAAYGDFCYRFGNAYWYYHEQEESRQSHAVSWFEEAISVYEGNAEKRMEYRRSLLYAEIGNFYKKIIAAQIDGTDSGMYGAYWDGLVTLKHLNDENRDRDFVTLRMYQELLTKSMEYAGYFKEDGVTKEEILSVYEEIGQDLSIMKQHATSAVEQEISYLEELMKIARNMVRSSYV